MNKIDNFFSGAKAVKLDVKNRVALPAGLRKTFEAAAEGEDYYYALDNQPQRIIIAKLDVIKDVLGDHALRDFAPFIQPFSPRSGGRFVISREFREHAGIENTAMVVGHKDYIALYAEQTWKAHADNVLSVKL